MSPVPSTEAAAQKPSLAKLLLQLVCNNLGQVTVLGVLTYLLVSPTCALL